MQELATRFKFDQETIDSPNLVGKFSGQDLSLISSWVWDGFVKDKASRREWEERNSAGMDLAMQIQKAKNFPWANCSNIIFPLVSIATLQFSTRSYSNLIRGNQIFKYRVLGKDQDGKQKALAQTMGKHLSWQCLEEDQAWEEQHDRLFMNTGIVGCAFIKTQFSPSRRHNTSQLVMAKDLVMHYYATSVEDCRRKTEVIELDRNEIVSKVRRGIYRDCLDESWFKESARVGIVQALSTEDHDSRVGLEAPQGDRDTPFTGLEQHCWMDCDGDGYDEPYTVLVEAASRFVLRIVARVDREEDVEKNDRGEILAITATEHYTKYPFIPAPDGGIYDMGFGVLLGPLNEAANTGINQIFDAGTSNMLGGGFAASGAKLQAGVYTRTPGEWKIIKGMGDDIRKSLVNFPEIPISNVLFQVISLVIQYADRLAGSTETMAGENPGQNTPAQTYQGMVDQGMQVYKSIFKRIWRSMKEEGKKLHKLNSHFLPDSSWFGDVSERITREAYRMSPDRLAPVADPALVSDAERIQRALAVRTAAHSVPGYNVEEAEKDYLEALGVDNVPKVYPGAYSQWAQQHPLPNPKAQVEQMKIQGLTAKLQYEKWKTVTTLQAGQKKMMAEIDLIRAQAAKMVAEIGAEKAALQLQAFDVAMTHLSGMVDMVNERIDRISSETDNAAGEDSKGRAGGDQESSSGKGAVGASPPQGGGSEGPVGGGDAQQ